MNPNRTGSRDRRAPWRIRHELLWARVFATLAGSGREPAERYELHDELADLYFELAASYRARGFHRKAQAAERKAFECSARGTPPEPLPAAALAMPVPRLYTTTHLVGRMVPAPDPKTPDAG